MNEDMEQALLAQAIAGDDGALGSLMQLYYPRLERVIRFRMDPRLHGRLDPDDVLQESFLEATRRFGYYLQNRKTSFFLWLRYLCLQKLNELHRHHFGVKARDRNREVSIFGARDQRATTRVPALLRRHRTRPWRAGSRQFRPDFLHAQAMGGA